MADFVIGSVNFSEDGPDGPDSKYVSIEWELTNEIVEKKIPGKGNKFITIRTSDVWKPNSGGTGPLWKCSVVQRCISEKRFYQIWNLVTDKESGGSPYMVEWAGPRMEMYITKGTFRQDPGFPEPGSQASVIETFGKGEYVAFIGTWTLNLIEAAD